MRDAARADAGQSVRRAALAIGLAILGALLAWPEPGARAEPPEHLTHFGYEDETVAELTGYHDDGPLDGELVVDVLLAAGVLEHAPGANMALQWDQVPDVVRQSATPPARPPAPRPAKPPPPAPEARRLPPTPQREPRWAWPTRRGVITSEFGRRRGRRHEGIDIAARSGEPIHATAAGTVIYASSRMSGYGNAVIVHHGGSTTSLYAHARRLDVRKGDRVDRGTRIASVGSTGRATGPHLHFEIRVGTQARNPREFLPRGQN